MSKFVVLVCGGRNYADETRVQEVLDEYRAKYNFSLLVEGGANGADCMAHHWARRNKVETVREDADWSQYGKAAGPIRNQAMLDKYQPDLVIAFPGGRGTEDMVNKATKFGVQQIVRVEGRNL